MPTRKIFFLSICFLFSLRVDSQPLALLVAFIQEFGGDFYDDYIFESTVASHDNLPNREEKEYIVLSKC